MSHRASRNLGLQFLMDRRARDEANRFYNEAAAQDSQTRQRAQFETRTLGRFQSGEIKRRAQNYANEREQQLEVRRQKLAQLLAEEEEQFSREVQASVETPATRRERLMAQLAELRQRRQEEHDTFVAEKMEQGWRDSCDPLRHQISEALQRQVIKERDQQLIEHEQERLKGDEAEEKYAAQVQKNVAQWKADLEKERQVRREKMLQNRTTWVGQMDEKAKILKDEKDREYQESLEFRTTIEGKLKADREAAELKARQQAERRRELDELNTEQIANKKRLIDEDKAIDAMYARQAAEELRQQEEDELVNRIVAQRKADMNKRLLTTQLGKKEATDARAEMFLNRAQQEANDKEDAMRRKDAEMRRNLMLDAVADRVKTIKLHEQQKIDQRNEKLAETKRLEEEIAFQKQIDREEAEFRQLRIKNQYEMLQAQSKLKAENEAREKRENQEAVRKMVEGWAEEEKRIQKELENPRLFVGNRFRGIK